MYEGSKDMHIREAAWLDTVKRGGIQTKNESPASVTAAATGPTAAPTQPVAVLKAPM